MARIMRSTLTLSAFLLFCGAALQATAEVLLPEDVIRRGPEGPEPGAQRRAWGPEQATGAPDTFQMGDITTAWASREPDAGMEWLEVVFERSVDIAEVRVRESYNPGAICRVVATVDDGAERLLWDGEAGLPGPPPPDGPAPDPENKPAPNPAPAPGDDGQPRDFVVTCKDKVVAKMITIYLDSIRVPGWNEIDAVQLVGKDGSRQWAQLATASSTYAEQGRNPPVAPVPPQDPFDQLAQRRVEVFLDAQKTIRAVFVRRSGNLLVLNSVDGLHVIILNLDRILGVQTVE